MAITNHDRIGKGLDVLSRALKLFVEQELKSEFGDDWIKTLKTRLGAQVRVEEKDGGIKSDPAVLLKVMWEFWNDVFGKTLGRPERSMVSELIDVRNKWAHKEPFATDDAYRSLDSMKRLAGSINAAKESDELDNQKGELLRLKFDEQARNEKRKISNQIIEGVSIGGLKPWRELVTPHPDVTSGKYQQAEFAADLWQVYNKQGSNEYKDPVEFFRRTFLTSGLTDLLTRAILRLSSEGGDPVIELQTNFGGGKTHSMLALFHLFSGSNPKDLPGIDTITAGIKSPFPKKVKRVVLVGNKLTPGQPEKKDDGTVVRTIWGELAWQLGGKEGYAMLKQADETATNPGDLLGKILKKYTPCLILIDEWVAYARQLHDSKDLPAGDFDTQFTFAQTLTEEVKAAPGAILVVSLPSSSAKDGASPTDGINDEEVGGNRGKEALVRLRNVLHRVAAQWRPASAEESYEIVRRRLFQELPTDCYKTRDLIAKTFCEFYRDNHQEFPPECQEADYERKIKAAFPIHPEVFERLYQDWSGLVKFQRTRGVLRLMAAVIHALWEREDRSILILPAHLPLDHSKVMSEFCQYLPDRWETVIEKDIDGADSLPRKIDLAKTNLGRYSACRRVARALFLGSAPMPGAANRGVEDRRIKLGCAQPGESPSLFGDALRHMAQSATYLYQDSTRYWYSTQPTVTKLADDRAEQFKNHPDEVAEEIKNRVREDIRNKGDFASIHAFPANSGEVPDELETRLVILGVDQYHSKDSKTPSVEASKQILDSRGTSPRLYKNTLVFLAPDRGRMEDLDQAVRYFLAWNSIVLQKGEDGLNLDPRQTSQAENQRRNWENAIKSRLNEAYQWLLFPTQPDPRGSIEWQSIRLSGQEPLAVRAGKKLKNDSQMVGQYAFSLLKKDMDRSEAPLWRGNHVPIKQLVEDYATYLYLQRVKDPGVIEKSIMEGLECLTWEIDSFAYAETFDATANRYTGLRCGSITSISSDNAFGLLVKSPVAQEQMRKEVPSKLPGEAVPVEGRAIREPTAETDKGTPQPKEIKPKRFHGSMEINVHKMSSDTGKISDEVVQHLAAIFGSQVNITLDIEATIPNGVDENIVRTVNENCRTLKFRDFGFEKQ